MHTRNWMRVCVFHGGLMVAALASAALLPANFSAHAAAAAAKPTKIAVTEAWARAPGNGDKEVSVYLKVSNNGADMDRFMGVTTPFADHAMLMHDSEDHGVKFMLTAGPIELPGHYSVMFVPGGSHVMLRDLKKPVKAGDTFPLTLIFANAENQDVTVKVLAANATGPK